MTSQEIIIENIDAIRLGLPENFDYSNLIFKLILKKDNQIIDEKKIRYLHLG